MNKNFLVYKASAGSGKTYNLVKIYLQILLTSSNFRQILAVTFTNKAAKEMKERIINALQGFVNNFEYNGKSYQALANDLTKDTGLSAEAIQSKAKQILTNILHHYSDFAVLTLDKFSSKIVRTFAHDLQLKPNFEIILEQDTLIEQAIDQLVGQIGKDQSITEWLLRWAKENINNSETKSWEIKNELKQIARFLFEEDSLEHIEKIKQLTFKDFENIQKQIKRLLSQFEATAKAHATAFLQIATGEYGLTEADFYYVKSGIYAYMTKIVEGNIEMPNIYVYTTIQKNKWNKSGKNAITEPVAQILSKPAQNLISLFETQYKDYKLLKAVQKNLTALAVLTTIQKNIFELYDKDNVLHLSENNKRIANIVQNEEIPFIYMRMGEKYAHFLIDEFQDTSIMQWQNLLPLVENSLANNHLNLIVGDAKQAIYRFRNGEVQQFSELPKIYKAEKFAFAQQREQALISNHQPINLTENYRSLPVVVNFNNAFFDYWVANSQLPEHFRKIYDQHQQKPKAQNGGYVNIKWIEPKDKSTNDEKKVSFNQNFLPQILNIILQQKNKGFTYRDIAILTRKNDQIKEIANYLLANNINVISQEALTLEKNATIQFFINVMTLIANPLNLNKQIQIIEYLNPNYQETLPVIKNIIATVNHKDKTKTKQEGYTHFKQHLKNNNYVFDIEYFKNLSLYEIAETIHLIFKLNKTNDVFYQSFLEEILKFTQKQGNNLMLFLDWFEQNAHKIYIKTSEDIDAVRLMTIHKSKGLEFPIVILPIADKQEPNKNKQQWVDLNLNELPKLKTCLLQISETDLKNTDYAYLYEEEKQKRILDTLNIYYVAFTRAENKMFVLVENNDAGAINKQIKGYLMKNNLLLENQELPIEMGEDNQKLEKTTEKMVDKQPLFDSEKLPYNNWRQEFPVRRITLNNSNTEYGNLWHLILSRIKTKEDIAPTLQQLYFDGMIKNDKELQYFTNKAHKIVENQIIAAYFKEDLIVKTEQSLLLPNGQVYRPDRIVIDKSGRTTIIDYKTSKPTDEHLSQIRQYKNILQAMNQEMPKAFLVYLQANEIKVVEA